MLKRGFVCQREDEVDFSTPCGSPIRLEIQYVPDDAYGHLEKIGETNTDEVMVAEAMACALPVLIARFANGDTTALAQAQGFYADVTTAPHSLADAYRMTQDAKSFWDALTPDQKKQFDGFDHFCSTAGSEKWFKAFAPPAPPAPPAPDGSDGSAQPT